jgi:hypothetical protein
MSKGTPITRMRRVGSAWVPLGGTVVEAVEVSAFFDMQKFPPGKISPP